MQENAVEFRHISMEFPGVLANDDVSLDIRKGEVFALVGENGAGKTTLMNILYGIHEPTNGEVYIRGRKVERFSPKTAISMGVGMVHQHRTDWRRRRCSGPPSCASICRPPSRRSRTERCSSRSACPHRR